MYFKIIRSSILIVSLSLGHTIFATDKTDFDSFVTPFLEKYCIDCHDDVDQEGGVALHDLKAVTPENAALWMRTWEQVALKQMPPKKRKASKQPSLEERFQLSNWITGEMELAMKDHGGFSAHQSAAKGNHLDHDLLFGKLEAKPEPGSSPARIWRLSPQEHMNRLNDLINAIPEYDPQYPGRRSHGDPIPPDKYGDAKVYYSLDRIVGHIGGFVAYETAVRSFPSVMTLKSAHGLKNYSNQYSVNGSEVAQISTVAKDIIHYMAFGPDALPHQYVDSKKEVAKEHLNPDFRGLPKSLFYKKEMTRPLSPVYSLLNKDDEWNDDKLREAIYFLYRALTFKDPKESESNEYLDILKNTIASLGKKDGLILGLTPIFLDRDALYRTELADYGTPDEYGRVMLQGEELLLAINAALAYVEPDAGLREALKAGKLKTVDDVRREVKRLLDDESFRKPKITQFFREYFDYDYAIKIDKDKNAVNKAGGTLAKRNYQSSVIGQVVATDRLIQLIVEEDTEVLKNLLTTNRVILDPEKDWRQFSVLEVEKEEREQFKLELKKAKEEREKAKKVLVDPKTGAGFFSQGQKKPIRMVFPTPKGFLNSLELPGRKIETIVSNKRNNILTTLPKEQRMGILTQPSWLISHSDAMDNHAILRGLWVRQRLLGGAVPEVPITVDAQLPDRPDHTLRQRMHVTREKECWTCHQKMDPLGLPFETFNHIGRFVEFDHGKKVDATGEIIYSGDPELDGPVENAFEMIERLAKSERVEQVFVRYAFRFWMGRNETLADAQTLQEAHRAYRESGGSMKALILYLLSSDAFLYRK
ncbi:hypothetical protein LNTAR_07164 [Lentisphaera araneosa HTCC2155]|uniref:Cytochrome c domain-containing protein n=1 Tax=Lentisphaera araneosa HTCC2155 TaxID=313628 RepID=A6DMW8_9BACT|nr:DUF1588 domain-containing protein [Lentisphaera araneosa]EDM27004.1 hypothetical protein LNTAR_07164 [Lentisphaera araneosa HTCC2155]